MGLISDLKEAETRQHTPKIAFVVQKVILQLQVERGKSSRDDLHVELYLCKNFTML